MYWHLLCTFKGDMGQPKTRHKVLVVFEALDVVPLLLSLAGTALQYPQQRQQGFLQAPAADLYCIRMICESLALAFRMPSSSPAVANAKKQQQRNAAPGEQRTCSGSSGKI